MPRLLRRTAALLTSLALLAVPARGALACEMEAVVAEATPRATTQATTQATRHDVPVGHGRSLTVEHDHGPMSPSDEMPAGEPHPPCDHLVGCASVALANGAVQLSEFTTTSSATVWFIASGTQSPGRALEPPPPKRCAVRRAP